MLEVGDSLADLIRGMTDDQDGLRRAKRAYRVECVIHHRFAHHRMQHLGQLAFHAGALTRGENHGGKIHRHSPFNIDRCDLDIIDEQRSCALR